MTLRTTPTTSQETFVVLAPGDDGYDRAVRPWNVAVSMRPAIVVVASTAAHVADAVRYAAERGLRVAVQCTGHGAAVAAGDDVLLVCTSGLDEVRVDPDGSARVGAGVRWQQVVDAAVPHGLAPLNGSSLDVGVVGYLTGGGLGPVARTFGWASDRVTAFDLVTADGRLRRVSSHENPDLFWGLRGGKGSLGIVTAAEFDLVPLVTLYGGALWLAGHDAETVLERWRSWSAGLPDEATTSVALTRLPEEPGVPEQMAGRLTVSVRFAYVGDAAEGEAWFGEMRSAAPALLDNVGVLPYAAVGVIHADPVEPLPFVERSLLLSRLTGSTIGRLLAVAGPGSGSSLVTIELRRLGGAVARPGPRPSAVSHRDAAFSVVAVGLAPPELAPAATVQAESVVGALRPWSHPGTLPNFGQSGPTDYDATTLARLRSLIAVHDPNGLLVAGDPLREQSR